MIINLIVVAVTLLMGVFLSVWLACPQCRLWIESPKWQPMAWDDPAGPFDLLPARTEDEK